MREKFRTHIGFILAGIAQAVGIGNIWRFPYIFGQSGGGAFLIPYFIGLFLIGIPLFILELSLGRNSKLSPIGAFRKIKEKYKWVGVVIVANGFLILSYYTVVTGWTLAYFARYITLHVPANASTAFYSLAGINAIDWQLVVMLLAVAVVARGVRRGIEKVAKIVIPALFFLLIGLAVWAVSLPGAGAGLQFYLNPDFSKLTLNTWLLAFGQVFFTLGISWGILISYGSYLKKKEDIAKNSMTISLADTAIALLAGFVIFPAIFTFGLNPAEGPGLAFITLPTVFGQLPAGTLIGMFFFAALFLAAITSTIALLEVLVSTFIDEIKWTRRNAVLLAGGIVFIIGIPSAMYIGFLDLMNLLAGTIMLPAIGILTCLAASKVLGKLKEESNSSSRLKVGKVWTNLIKYIIPILLAAVIMSNLLL